MRIVDVCAFYAPQGGGVKTYVRRKLAAGPRLDAEIVILAPGKRHAIEHFGPRARIEYLPAPRFPLDRAYRYFDDPAAVHATLDRLQPDVVEVSSPWRSAEIVAAWPGHAARVLIMHADPLAAYAYRWFGMVASRSIIDRTFAWYWRHLLRLDRAYDLVISASTSLTQRLSAGGLKRVETIPMGVEAGQFTPSARDERLRAQLLASCGLPPDATLLIGIGRFSPEKRWPMVIDAVTAAGHKAPVGLVIVGGGRDEHRLLRHIAGNPHVRLMAPISARPKLAAVLASSDALIHGCEAETYCMVAAEGRASGLPLIVPNEGGAADQVIDGCGEIFMGADPASASAAIARFIAKDRVRQRMAASAVAPQTRTIDEHFADLFKRYASLRQRQDAA